MGVNKKAALVGAACFAKVEWTQVSRQPPVMFRVKYPQKAKLKK